MNRVAAREAPGSAVPNEGRTPLSVVAITPGARENFSLSKEVLDQLKSLGRQEQTALFVTLGTGLMVLLNRYTGMSDVLVEARFSKPPPGESEIIETVRFRSQGLDSLPFRSLLRQVREPELSSEQPQVMFVLESGEEVSRLAKAAGGRLRNTEPSQYDLSLSISETANGLEGVIAYPTNLFDANTIQRLCGHYGALLAAIARDPDQSISTLPMLTERERNQILFEWNDTRAEYPEISVHELFEREVARHPDATALVFEGEELSYREVNERANQVAHHLRKRGVGSEVLVGVCLERCPQMLFALLGVWKAGGAYVPLDPSYPQERLSYMLTDSAAKIVVTDRSRRRLFPLEDERVITIDSDWPTIERESTSNLDSTVIPSNLAYVMYTSGSTGQPKGVMVLHRGLVNYLTWAAKAYAVDEGESVPVHTSIAFDLTVSALYVPLCGGGRIELLRDDVGGQNLVAALRETGERSLVKITPAHLALLSEQLGAKEANGRARLFVIGGENLLAESLLLWRDRAPETRLINEYGPTETVVGCCVYEVQADDPRTGSVPIGRPIANTQLYVLDRHQNPLPVGIVGELFIGGAGVARGYLNRPELTEERFIADPFSGESGARLYKTGDMVRYRVDGTLEYLGRVDNQVKVRGYRIELGEIEAALADHPGVRSSAVLAREDTPGNKQLVGYVVLEKDEDPTVEDLRDSLRDKLPEYMVPTQIVFLDSMPLTTNGKVDRNALVAPSPDRVSPARGRVAPRTETERALAAIWTALLNVEDIGVDDDFFDLGGYSLLAIKAVARIRDTLAVELSPQALMDNPTIAGLARTMAEVTADVEGHVENVESHRLHMGPFFFGEPQLFGVYHPSQSPSVGETALLVCSSIGHEHTRAHRAVQALCESAARAGVPALRFDYTGVGDSAGEFSSANVDVWCADVLRAVDELRARSGARDVHVVGLRFGAALAAAALRRAGSREARAVSSLSLWDPLVSGTEFLQLASRFQQRFLLDSGRFGKQTLRRRAAEQGSIDDPLCGYSFPAAMRRSLEALDLRRVDAWPSVAIRTVLSEPSAVWEEVAVRLESADRPVAWELVKGAEGAWADYARHEKILRAGPVISRIVEHVARRHR